MYKVIWRKMQKFFLILISWVVMEQQLFKVLVLLTVVVAVGGMVSVYALIGLEFFMSIMFPTIFSLSIQSLGSDTKLGSSLLVMSIVGGAVFPLIMGRISDMSSIQWAYSVPLVCFFVVLYFGYKGYEVAIDKR